MIVVEKVLTAVFGQIPAIQQTESFDGYKPVYKWGNEYHLIKQLENFSKAGQSIYPLIYQISNTSNQNTASHNVQVPLVLIISCINQDESLLNEQRWAMSYQNILVPIVERIEECFNKAGVFVWDGNYKVDDFPNYGNGKEHNTIEKWDAIRFETSIIIEEKSNGEPKCINNIRFK